MDFAEPQWMQLAAVLTPLMAVFLARAAGLRRVALARFIRARWMDELTIGVSAVRQRIKAVLRVVGLACVLVALGRPLWGYGEAVAQATGRDLVVCVDVSRSMMATDTAPSRLARAKLACYDLLSVAKTDRIGLVAFAGSAFLQCPLALDGEAFRQNVAALDTDLIPEQGTALAAALDEAAEAFSADSGTRKAVILITDGEDHEELAEPAARRLAAAGISLFTVGVGTPKGELLKGSDPYGNAVFVKDEDGNPVKSQLNEPLLQRLAEAARGFYLPLQSSRTMATLYERGIAPMEAVRFSSATVRSRIERFQWPLGLGLLLLLAELLLPGASTAAGRPPWGLPVRTAAALALWVACLGLPSPARAASDEALERYRKGEYATSRQEYERLARENPDEFRLRFNAGAAAYKMDDFEGAAGLFEQVLRSPDLDLQQKAWYNLGNARFRAGESEQDPEKKRAQWQQALSSFTGALKLNPGDTAAQANHRATQQAIEAILQPPPPQQGGRGKENSKNDPRQNSEGSKDAGQDSKDPKGGDPSKDDRKEGKEGKEGNSSGGDAESSKGSPNSQAKDSSQGKNPSQGGRGEPQDRKPGEGRSNASSASGAKPAQSSGDRRGDEAQAGVEGSVGEPDKDARRGELMTIREAEKVLDGQKGSEKALVLRRRRGVVGDLGEGAGQAARRKAW
ncbi:MAG: VWA domain-containing protein [Verrucomicrobia bacterium]|nr:VWA domain-containing protein [Verrucomicrobiota bacterium]